VRGKLHTKISFESRRSGHLVRGSIYVPGAVSEPQKHMAAGETIRSTRSVYLREPVVSKPAGSHPILGTAAGRQGGHAGRGKPAPANDPGLLVRRDSDPRLA
jgi:hypothetical protein